MLIRKKIVLVILSLLALLFILTTYNREVIKSYISKEFQSQSTRTHLVNIARVVIPLKNFFLMRNIDDKIALLKASGACTFCDLSQGSFKGDILKDVDLRYAVLIGADLSNTNLSGANLRNTNLSEANLSGVDLSNQDLTGVNLTHSNLSGVNLDGVILVNKDLTGVNLNGVDLRNKILIGVNLSGVDLRNKDLTGVNLSGVDLSNQDLTGVILTHSNLSGVNLSGVDLRNKDLTGVNLSGVDLSNQDLTGVILKNTKKIEISIKNPSNSNLLTFNDIQNMNITRYDLSENIQYLSTKEGSLFEFKNNELKLVLDLTNKVQFPLFSSNSVEAGLLGVASKGENVYVSYTNKNMNGIHSLIVDEFSVNFTKTRNIIKIEEFNGVHFGGNLVFDNYGQLYLSVGDGYTADEAQNLNSLKGKILRLDVSNLKLEPEIIAYGIRNPWGVSIDSKNRMFVLQCGRYYVEAVFLLNDLYSDIPDNLGWPVYEGSKRMGKDTLIDLINPIFETYKRPGCLTAGVYLDDLESFLFADFYGTIRLIKQQENGDWYMLHEYKQENYIWGFGLDKKTKKIFIAPKNLELEILIDQVKLN
jgi:uncharacterized protein YjbI with pentapeptide repeats